MNHTIERFDPSHLLQMRVRPAQVDEYAAVMAADHRVFGNARTVLIDGQPAFCAGVITKPDCGGCGVCWAIFTPVTMRHMVIIHREVMAFLEEQPNPRLQTTVRTDYEAGHKWARKLGFTAEGVLRSYDRHGNDYTMYAKVKP